MTARFVLPLAALALGTTLLTGCSGDPTLVGRMGITADAEGRPVLVLAPCGGSIDQITLGLLPQGNETDSGTVGSWQSGSAVRSLTHLALGDTTPAWTGDAVHVDPRKHYIAQAISSSHPADAFNDVTFAGDQIATLDPTKVYVNSDDPDSAALVPHTATDFQTWACKSLRE